MWSKAKIERVALAINIGLATAFAHFAITFVAWARASTPHSPAWAYPTFTVLGVPLLTLVRAAGEHAAALRGIALAVFFPAMIVNSLGWGAAVGGAWMTWRARVARATGAESAAP